MFLMDSRHLLEPANKAYESALETYVLEAFWQDLADGDISTRYFVDRPKAKIRARIVAKESGILAGMQEAEWLLKKLKIDILDFTRDGKLLQKGDVILILEGEARAILAAERTLLNLLQRMSGVATKTRRMRVKLLPGIELLATRKTLWGLLDKRAVVVGGGCTHRLNLSDAILIKENHLALAKNFEKALKASLKKRHKGSFFEIELESPEQVQDFLTAYEPLKKKLRIEGGVAVMLDNFSPSAIRKALPALQELGVIVEASGGITEGNIARYNIQGLSAVSAGALTTKAPNLDMSLEIEAS